MENINGIQVDVSAVLADKVAELAVATISKERMEQIGQNALEDITTSKGNGWNSEPSKCRKVAAEKYYKEVSKYFDELVNSEEYQQKAKEEAELIIKEMKEKIHKDLVETVSGQLSGIIVSPYGCVFRNNIEQIVLGMIQNRNY